jgi:signal transduction histidine kinase
MGRELHLAAIPIPGEDVLLPPWTYRQRARRKRAARAHRRAGRKPTDQDRVRVQHHYELRTPLTSIAGFAEMMEAGLCR